MERARVRAAAEVPAFIVVGSAMEPLEDADAAALVTEWAEFAGLDSDAVAGTMRQPLIVDGRNALAPERPRPGRVHLHRLRPGRMDPEEVGATMPAVAGISAVVAGQTAPAAALGLTEATLLGDY